MTIERVETAYGPMWIPDTDTHQYGWLKRGGISCEEFYIREVLDLLREGQPGTAVDVGACFGCWTLPLLAACRLVVAIEPQPRIFQLLRDTVGSDPRCHVINAAAGDVGGTRVIPLLDLDKPCNFGDAALRRSHSEQLDAPMTPVRSMKVDDLGGSYFDVTFIKIDVQGMEPNVLRGAEATIARCKPWLFVEAHPSYGNPRAIREQIEAMGYVCLARGDNFLAGPT